MLPHALRRHSVRWLGRTSLRLAGRSCATSSLPAFSTLTPRHSPASSSTHPKVAPFHASSVETLLETGALAAYGQRVQEGKVRDDPFQRDVVSALDRLQQDLLAYAPKRAAAMTDASSLDASTATSTSSISAPSSILSRLFWSDTTSKTAASAKASPSTPKGLYIHGSVGTGKTMLMNLFHDTLPLQEAKRRVHFHVFMQDIHKRIQRLREQDPMVDAIPVIAADLAKEHWILCFDEFQVTDIADAMILRRLFGELFSRDIIMVATSNRHPDALYENGIQRKSFLPCIDALKVHCSVIDLDSGVDYRQSGPTSTFPLFFTTATTPDAKEAFEKLYTQAIKEDPVTSMSFSLLGRQLEVPRATATGVARFTFDELCGSPLSAADYFELTQHFRVIFLEDIPQMDQLLRNEARRFITLLDAMYEQQLTLVCSSVSPLRELFVMRAQTDAALAADRLLMDDLGLKDDKNPLFTGEEEYFAFQRAISRLVEMQRWPAV